MTESRSGFNVTAATGIHSCGYGATSAAGSVRGPGCKTRDEHREGRDLRPQDARQGHLADIAMPVLDVAPVRENGSPAWCRLQVFKSFGREFRPVFGSVKQGFGIGVVVA